MLWSMVSKAAERSGCLSFTLVDQ